MSLTSILIIVFVVFSAPILSIDVGFSLKAYMLFSAFILFFQRALGKVRIDIFDWVFIVFIIYGGITVLIAQDPISTMRMFLGAIISYGSSMIIRGIIQSKTRFMYVLPKVIVTYSWIIVSLSLFLYLYQLISLQVPLYTVNNTSYLGLVIERNMPRLTGLSNDPNIFAFSMALPFWWLNKNRGNSKSYHVLYFAICLCIILTLSRSAIIIYGFLLIVAMLSKPKNLLKSFRLFVAFGIVSLFVYVIFVAKWEEFLLPILRSRYESAGTGSGRFELWQIGLEIFKSNPVFGIGWYNFLFYNVSYYGGTNYAHNTFLEVLVELGVVGFLLYLAFHTSVILKFYRLNFKPKYLLYTYFTMVLFMNTLSVIINETFFLTLALISLETNE